MKYEVRKGREFPIDHLQVERRKLYQDLEGTHNRTLILRVSLCMTAVFLIGAAIMGIVDGQFGRLQSVYNVASPFIFGLAGYYYGKKPI